MLDIKKIKENPEGVKAALHAKEVDCDAAIDRILVKGLAAEAVRRFDRYETEEYCFISDHAPVWIDVEI